MRKLHLASASPRRRELLANLGLEFTHGGVDLDERQLPDEDPAALVVRLAREKARAAQSAFPDCVVLGSDTEVVLEGRVFGKPASADEARDMLLALAGRTHQVLTGVALVDGDRVATCVSRSDVRFRAISAAEAAAYWRSGEPRDKAGGYAMQGLGGIFVEEVRGSYSGVIGLPVFETSRLLADAGIDVL